MSETYVQELGFGKKKCRLSSLRRKNGMSVAQMGAKQWSSKYSIFRYLKAPTGLRG